MTREECEKTADALISPDYEGDTPPWHVEWGTAEMAAAITAELIRAFNHGLETAASIEEGWGRIKAADLFRSKKIKDPLTREQKAPG